MKSQVRSALVCLAMVLVLALGFIPTLGITASAADGYTVSFSTPAGVTAPEAKTVAAGESVTLPTVDAAKEGYTFVGWTTGVVADTTTAPELFTESYTPTADVTLYAVYSYNEGPSGWILTDIKDVKSTDVVVITMKMSNGNVYAMTNNNGSSKAPGAVKLTMENGTISGDVENNVLWNIGGSADAYIIYPNGSTSTWLYSTSTNNGTRVGTNENKTWALDSSSGYLKHLGTNRYLGVYNSSDWRSYTNTTGNTANQTLGIYVLAAGTTYYTTDSAEKALLNINFSTPAEGTAVDSMEVYAGMTATLPVAENIDGFTFIGWSETPVNNVTVRPELLTEYTFADDATEDVTLYAVYSYASGMTTVSGCFKTDLTLIKPTDTVIIVATKSNGTTFALSSAQGSSAAPKPIAVTVNGNELVDLPDSGIFWNIDGNADGMTIYVAGSTTTWLYCTNDNNGVRVGTNDNKAFLFDSASGYLKHNSTNRYIGVYNEQDWRCYTSHTQANIANQTFAFYVQGETTTVSYAYTSTLPEETCTHENTATETVNATCTVAGYTRIYCVSCGETISNTPIEAKGHSLDNGTVTTEPTCATKGVKTYACTNECSYTKTEEIDALGHSYANGVCGVCGDIDPLSTNYSGRYYIGAIRTSGNYFYFTGDLGTASTKRYQIVDSGVTELPASISNPNAMCVFVLEQNADGTYCIYAEGIDGDAKYLGWTSGNSGTLVTADAALKVSVDKTKDGLYNIHFAASDAERYLSLNANADNPYAAWYKDGQRKDLALIPVVEAEEEETVAKISDVNVNLGASLAMKYFVTLAGGESIADYKMVVTMNGETVTIAEYTEQDGKYVFAFTGIAPQCMTDTIKAELVKGDEVVSVKENYSVAQYAKEVLELYADNAELYTLVVDMLFYGAAAQEYRNYNVENLATSVLPANVGQSDLFPSQDGNTPLMSDSTNAGVFFTAAGVVFDNVNKIYVKFNANAENVTVKVGDKELAVETLADGQYVVTTDGVYATDFDKMVTFELVVDGETVQTLSYSVNCYCARKANLETAMGKLAHALYVYGVSADAYAAAN